MEDNKFDYEKWLEEKKKREEESEKKRESRLKKIKIGAVSGLAIAFIGFAMMWNFGKRFPENSSAFPSGGTSAVEESGSQSTKVNKKEAKAYFLALKPVYQEWEDEVKLAENTPRMDLPQIIEKLQEIKREAQALKTPSDITLMEISADILDGMDMVIDGYIKFMGAIDPDLGELKEEESAAAEMIDRGETKVTDAYFQLMDLQ